MRRDIFGSGASAFLPVGRAVPQQPRRLAQTGCRYADGNSNRLLSLTAELMALKVDARGLIAADATQTIVYRFSDCGVPHYSKLGPEPAGVEERCPRDPGWVAGRQEARARRRRVPSGTSRGLNGR